jgi:hypothetical protein
MIDRVEQRLALKPHRLVGDTAYGTASLLGWMVEEKAIEPYVPVWDKSQRRDETFSSSEFHWNEAANKYRCPQGHALRSASPFKGPHNPITKDNTIIYRSNPADCSNCVLKSRCCPNTPARRIQRSIHENARDVARRIALTPEYGRSRCERKKVGVLFAHLKRVLKLDRLRLRGLSGARDEFLMAANRSKLEANGDVVDVGCSKLWDRGDVKLTRQRRPQHQPTCHTSRRRPSCLFDPSFSTESAQKRTC